MGQVTSTGMCSLYVMLTLKTKPLFVALKIGVVIVFFLQSRIEELKSFLNQKGMLHLSSSVVKSISKQLKCN